MDEIDRNPACCNRLPSLTQSQQPEVLQVIHRFNMRRDLAGFGGWGSALDDWAKDPRNQARFDLDWQCHATSTSGHRRAMCEIREAAFLDASIRNIPARAFDVEPQQPDPQHAPRLYPKAKPMYQKT